MPSYFTHTGATRMLSTFSGTGAVAAQDMWVMLLKQGWDNGTNITPPLRSNTTYSEWVAQEASFTGYGRVQITGSGANDKMGSTTDELTATQLANDTEMVWTCTSAGTGQLITGAAIVDQASTTPTAIFAFATFDVPQEIGEGAGQTVRIFTNELLLLLG